MTTPNLSIHNLKASSSAVIPAAELNSRRHFRFWEPKIQLLTDFLAITLGLQLFVWLFPAADVSRECAYPQRLLIVMSTAAISVALIFRYTGANERAVTPLNISETEALLRGVGFSLLLLVVGAHHAGISGKRAVLSGASALGLLLLQRCACRLVKGWVLRRGLGIRHILIYDGPDNSPVLTMLSSNPSSGLECEAVTSNPPYLSPSAGDQGRSPVGGWGDQRVIARGRNVGEIFVADPRRPQRELAATMRDSKRLNHSLIQLREAGVFAGSGLHWNNVGNPFIAGRRTAAFRHARAVVKRVADLALCIPGLVLSLPICLMTSIAIKLDSGGPVFFRQDRIGKNGRAFRLWKFRSMHKDVPQYERSPLSDADARLTRVGRVIRRLSIDELPQLINVLCGDMSLVGPRPEMPFIVDQYGPFESRRLLVRPGITGLWQISPARAQPIHENMEYDLYYIHRQNIFLDVAILLRTLTAVVRGIGAT